VSARHLASPLAKLRAVLQTSPAKAQEFLHSTQEILQTARAAAVSARHLASPLAKLRAVLQISPAKTDNCVCIFNAKQNLPAAKNAVGF